MGRNVNSPSWVRPNLQLPIFDISAKRGEASPLLEYYWGLLPFWPGPLFGSWVITAACFVGLVFAGEESRRLISGKRMIARIGTLNLANTPAHIRQPQETCV